MKNGLIYNILKKEFKKTKKKSHIMIKVIERLLFFHKCTENTT